MMWILIQRNKANTKFKYLSSNDYNAIILI